VSFEHFRLNLRGIFLFGSQTSVDCSTTSGLISTLQPRMSRFHTVGAVLVDVCPCESAAIVSTVLMMIWGIWQNRNEWIWSQKNLNASQILNFVFLLQAEWKEVRNDIVRSRRSSSGQVAQHWQFQCSVSASFLLAGANRIWLLHPWKGRWIC
jgi:hypothetical protein